MICERYIDLTYREYAKGGAYEHDDVRAIILEWNQPPRQVQTWDDQWWVFVGYVIDGQVVNAPVFYRDHEGVLWPDFHHPGLTPAYAVGLRYVYDVKRNRQEAAHATRKNAAREADDESENQEAVVA